MSEVPTILSELNKSSDELLIIDQNGVFTSDTPSGITLTITTTKIGRVMHIHVSLRASDLKNDAHIKALKACEGLNVLVTVHPSRVTLTSEKLTSGEVKFTIMTVSVYKIMFAK